MLEEIDSAAERLRDANAGWVTRRDACEFLGKVAMHTLSILEEFSDEMDVDVRRSVDEALGKAAAALQGVKPVVSERKFALEELVRACEKGDTRQVEPDGENFIIRVKLASGRRQSVHVRPFKRTDGVDLIQVYTVCGKPEDDSYAWALRSNMKLIQSAVALAKQGDEERFVLTCSFLADGVTPNEMKLAVKEIAYYGDWMEKKFEEKDEF